MVVFFQSKYFLLIFHTEHSMIKAMIKKPAILDSAGENENFKTLGTYWNSTEKDKDTCQFQMFTGVMFTAMPNVNRFGSVSCQ